MLALNLPFIGSKIQEQDMPKIKGKFFGSFDFGYVLNATSKDYSFYIVPDTLDSFLISVDALKANLSFRLDPFAVEYLQGSGLMLIQLTFNSWAYLLSFARFAR